MRKVLLALLPVAVVALAVVPVLARSRGSAARDRSPCVEVGAETSDRSSPIDVPREPERRSAFAAPAAKSPPTAAFDWSTRTLDYRILGPDDHSFTFSVVRRADRLDIRFPLEAQEWFFERNPLSPSHFSGMLVNHRSKRILSFEFADLESAGIASDWKQAGLLGFDPSILEKAFEPTGEREAAFGMTFEHHRARVASAGQPTDVWWDAQELVLRRLVWRTKEGTWTQELLGSEPTADETSLRSPLVRHPRYLAIDAVDALESQACGGANCLPPSVKELMARLAGKGTSDVRRSVAGAR